MRVRTGMECRACSGRLSSSSTSNFKIFFQKMATQIYSVINTVELTGKRRRRNVYQFIISVMFRHRSINVIYKDTTLKCRLHRKCLYSKNLKTKQKNKTEICKRKTKKSSAKISTNKEVGRYSIPFSFIFFFGRKTTTTTHSVHVNFKKK